MSALPPGSRGMTFQALNRRDAYTKREIRDIWETDPNGIHRLEIDQAIQYVPASERGRKHVSRPFV